MWLLACSGGPDSMALLDLAFSHGLDVVVCHVNYHHRPSAGRDEGIVRDYCQVHDIPFEKLDASGETGNFQAWARKVRYDFFLAMAEKYGACAVLTAHQQDDVLETYLFQKERHMIPEHFGMLEESVWKGLRLLRPLLDWSKADLEVYCAVHHVSFGVDESNLQDGCRRNVIRHHVLPGLDRQGLLAQMDADNEWLAHKRKQADLWIEKSGDHVSLLDGGWFVLERWLYQKTGRHVGKKQAVSLLDQLQVPCVIDLGDFLLERHGSRLYVAEGRVPGSVCVPDRDALLSAGWCGFRFVSGGTRMQAFHVDADDFPLCVGPVQAGDKICLRLGSRSVNRFFVDRKMPRTLRRVWPVVRNRAGDVIFVPGIGCDAAHFSEKDNIYMVEPVV